MAHALKIGYVPEHFSAPLLMAKERSELGNHIELVCCPGGTGEMTQKLKDQSLDMAIALTEGLVAGQCKGQDWYSIVGTYVQSPLCWAISTGRDASFSGASALHHTRAGISRYGSGSHIMTYVLADQQGWLTKDTTTKSEPFDFVVLNNFEALREGVNTNQADFFLWETFMTKPFHDIKEIRRLGDITPPWPAFLIAAHQDVIANRAPEVTQALSAIQAATSAFMQLEQDHAVQALAHRFGHTDQDAQAWLASVRFAPSVTHVSRSALNITLETLVKAGVLSTDQVHDPAALCAQNIVKLDC